MSLSLVSKEINPNDEAISLIYTQRHKLSIYEAVENLELDHLTKKHREELARIFDVSMSQVNQIIKNAQNTRDCLLLLGAHPKHEYEYVDLILKKWQTQMTFSGIFHIQTDYVYDGVIVSKSDFETLDLRQRLQVMFADPKKLTTREILQELKYYNRILRLNYAERDIDNALTRWIDRNKNEIRALCISGLAYKGPIEQAQAEPEWHRLVGAITNTNQLETIVVLKHFIWQVKRKMQDLPVQDHMMPVLFGAQGSGKSTLIKDYLCKPIEDFTASTDFSAITDDRNHDIFKNWVLIFDEMGRSTVNHIEDIKRKVTEYSFTSRILGSHNNTIVKIDSTMIGTTNKDISRLLYDDTGMRRFFQINCLSQMNWHMTSEINYNLLWRSVNEKSSSPLKQDLDLYKRIQKIQNGKRQITLLEQWLRDRKFTIGQEEVVRAKALYDEYVEFHKEHNNDRCDVNSTNFGRSITDVALNIPGLQITKNRTNKGYEYTLLYSEEINLDLIH